MKRLLMIVPLALLALWALSGSTLADDGSNTTRARLSGFQEVPPKLTDGHGTLALRLHSGSIDYTLTYSGLTSTPLFAHIHFAQRGVNGGVVAFLCGGGGKPVCPAPGGTVTGTITAANVVAVADQNVTAGDFPGLLRIVRSGDAYANVHSTNFPAGEIRGQIPATSAGED
ncbi:MAG: CHRD domain-containing protein [Candidatus Nephthysia bennettiae]|uniref:CHRD domain-containing protein n=1 Tax=Candidatus Nephthysia bennettiae TaxID=3127016 RepID=A0A934K5L9_9BACT|nr:CHRD domain-containing protein [Candidatus Dormibacteraeota bacterium]PZR98946.1 MAG: CHRD domain-containing protein [Candidatus Dormibacteraeota bacterium]